MEDKLVLVVDDEDDPRLFLYSLLESDGYQVATCADGYEALDFVARQHPALAIADVRMPEMEGMELLCKIKHMSPATQVILYSAYGDWPMFLEALENGGADLIPKGASNDEILRVVRRVLAEVTP
jgi:DNA-binding NtrC family response regulator